MEWIPPFRLQRMGEKNIKGRKEMHTHELAERIARLQHDILILGMSNLSEARLHEMLDVISDQVAEYAKEAEHYYPKERKKNV